MKTQDLLKTFQPFFKTLSKASLPVIQYMEVRKGIARMTNLEIEVIFPVDLTDGYYEIRMNEAFRVRDLDDDFPLSYLHDRKAVENAKAILNPEPLLEVSKHIANDELRPVMNSINITAEGISGTDAHSLLTFNPAKVGCNVEGLFNAIVTPTMPFLTICKLALKENSTITAELYRRVEDELNSGVVKFQYNEITVIQRLVEGTYPNYKACTPDWSKLNLEIWEFDSKDLSLMAQTAKNFSVPATKLLNDGRCSITNIDLNLHKEFKVKKADKPAIQPCGLLMPMLISDAEKNAVTGLSSEKLARFISGNNSKVLIGVQFTQDAETKEIIYDGARAMAVWVIKSAQSKPEYQPKAKQGQKSIPTHVPAAATPAPLPQPDRSSYCKPKHESEEIHIVEYSEKAIAVFGNTKPFKNKFLNMFGRYNRNLTINNDTMPGWVFSKKRLEEIQKLIAC